MFPLHFFKNFANLGYQIFSGLGKTEKETAIYLQAFETKFNAQFDKKTFTKIVKRHSLQLLLINDTFTNLYGRSTTPIEQERSILYFIMVSVYDDFFDDKTLTEAELNNILYQPESFTPKNFYEEAFIYCHLFLLQQVADRTAYMYAYKGLHDAQIDSLQQFNPNISDEDLLSLTIRKGGFCLLMCRHYLNVPVVQIIDDCWYRIGSVIQLTNDLYDIYKDLQEGIQTFAVRTKNYQTAESLYSNYVNQFKQATNQLPFSYNKKISFYIKLSTISAFGYLAIENLKHLQSTKDSLPDFSSLPRKSLIIDMEKPATLWQLAKLAYKHSTL